MKITSISIQARDKNRVNVAIDGKYRFSLDLFQVVEIGLKVGNEYQESELVGFETESQFGKAYGRALEYCLIRPRSAREMRDYLYRKTRSKLDKNGQLRPGISSILSERVFDRLVQKGYIDDHKFARFWVENRSIRKGMSQRKLISELKLKGIKSDIIEQVIVDSDRDDSTEIQKIIAKKRSHYPDDKKLMMYLARLGFDYDEIKNAIKVAQED